ncbi:Macoilin [Folsomia candida]|uniref:Macoilin n=2 Tax=Folsomia candida TaxID=158441 RepID=A0A226EE41_FOLCA|nr:Macoilin [Folsomia candida]
MKRRNVDATKTRRPVKKIPKLYDGFYTGLVVYVKLVLLWVAVMGGDFLLEFRLEYLYPIYLLVHNAYEAYKFQGVAFALLLVCIVVSVDVICLGAIPPAWLFLLGSLAVWGQVGWSLTPLGPFLLIPTLIYLDGKSIRPLPTQPISPLAAHCVGFPLVSLGFAVKSFLGTKLKQRTRNDVGRQNDMLFSILWDALPNLAPPLQLPSPSPPPPLTIMTTSSPAIVNNNENVVNGSAVLVKGKVSPTTARRKSFENGDILSPLSLMDHNHHHHHNASPSPSPSSSSTSLLNGGTTTTTKHVNSNGVAAAMASSSSPREQQQSSHSHHHNNHHNHVNNNNASSNSNLSSSSGAASSQSSAATAANNSSAASPLSNSSHHMASSSSQYASPCPTCAAALLAPKKKKEECCIKLESEVRRLRSDLHSVRSVESDLRGQISAVQTSERNLRGDVALLQGEHEALQLKYSALQSKSQEERQSYEKKLLEERRQKDSAIKKQTKASLECSGDCKRKLRDADREKDGLRRDLKISEDKTIRLERELQNVKSTLMLEQKNKESSAETAKLLSLLSALQDQNAHLESSLGAETRLKLDLFSALGEARRQLSIR